jgi:hypothetical protein
MLLQSLRKTTSQKIDLGTAGGMMAFASRASHEPTSLVNYSCEDPTIVGKAGNGSASYLV